MHWIVPPKQKLFCILTACCITGISVNALAETAPITSSGLNTQISGPIAVDGNVQYNITGGTRAGANLFHSFGEFGVPDHTIANFHNDSGLATSNILGRVTGGNESQIFGTIRTSEFSGTNLFLMNPAGFLFGPDATVNVGGMASFTSAEYLRLSDGKHGGYFYADPAKPSLLTAYPVAAFGFLGSNPDAITVHGSEFRATGISLVGGDITIESGAQLSAPNGTIQFASTASPGEFDATSLQSIPNVNKTSFTSFGSITLAPESTVNLSGTDTVSIRAGRFVLKMNDAILSTAKSSGEANSISLAPNSSIISSTAGTERGADVQIAAAELGMNQARVINRTTGPGDAGSVKIHAQKSIHTTDSFISSSSNSVAENAGSGGQILLQAPLVEMSGGVLSSVTLGSGSAGNISIQTSVLNLSASASTGEPMEINASTSGPGQGGNISIMGVTGPGSRASAVTLSGHSSLLSETLDGRGGAGSISMETVRLALTEGSEITTASRLNNSGNAGNVTLNATESILLSGSFVKSNVLEGSTGPGGNISITTNKLTVSQNTDGTGGLISASTTSSGNAGTITINADKVVLADGGRLSADSSFPDDPILPPSDGAAGTILVQGVNGPDTRASSIVIGGQDGFDARSGIFVDAQGTGIGGSITLHANTVTIQNGGTISASTSGTASSAIGGSIIVNATDQVTLTDGTSITASSTGPAKAGKIVVDAGRQLLVKDSKITTEARQAKGGDITLVAIDRIHMANGEVSTSVRGGTGSGGNITIDPKMVVLQNSNILAKAVRGKGGDITITTQMFMPDSFSLNHIDASAPFGLNGTVRIQAPYAPGGGKIQPLGNQPLQATQLLNQRCAALTGGQLSSFTVAGRNSLPAEPGGWLSSPSILAISQSHGGTETNMSLGASPGEPRKEPPLLSLRQIAPSGFLTRAFAVDRQEGCTS